MTSISSKTSAGSTKSDGTNPGAKIHREKNTQKPGVLILIIKSRSNFLSKMSKMSVGNDHFINEQQTRLPDTDRDAGISGKFPQDFWVAK